VAGLRTTGVCLQHCCHRYTAARRRKRCSRCEGAPASAP